jgi:hypothetical protein
MLRLLLALAASVFLGLASRLYPMGWFLYDRVLGEVLWANLGYYLLGVVLIAFLDWATRRPRRAEQPTP